MSDQANLSEGKEKRKREILYLILIFLMLCSNGLLGWFWWKEKGIVKIITIEKENVKDAAEIVKQELIALSAQYENLKTDNQQMNEEIEAKKQEIGKLQKQLEKHKDDAYIIAKLKRETETLRAIMQHFVVEIDSLNTLNKNVIAEREVVKKELKTEKSKNTQLTKEKEDLQGTVNIASMLKAVGLSVSGIDVKKGGKKQIPTNKAKRCDRIRIAFTLAENMVAKKGDRIIYARIVTPDGKEMTQADDSTHIFKFGKSKGYWATKKTVNYINENTDVVLFAIPKEGEFFLNGKYIIEVNTDGVPIGSATLELE
ncbi:MAG: hypothetical protein HY840_10350 [Bacteroidetes bacterium]|nr:hypothetical protein [Bacteroidota bacterium]